MATVREIHPMLRKQLDRFDGASKGDLVSSEAFLRAVSDTYIRMEKMCGIEVPESDKELSEDFIRSWNDLKNQNRILGDTKKALLNVLEDSRETEKKLEVEAEELQKFKMIAENSFDHIIITDIDGEIIFANKAAQRNTGYSLDEMKGNTPRLWGGQMDKAFYERLWRVIKTDKESIAVEITNKRKNGEAYLAEARISPILDREGNPRFFVGLERDITTRRQTELQLLSRAKELSIAKDNLEQEQQKTKSILNFLRSIGDGVFATDMSGNIIFMNEMAERLSGMKSDQSLGMHYRDAFRFAFEGDEDSDYPSFVEEVLRTGLAKEILGHTVLLGENGLKTPIANEASPIMDEKGVMIGCVVVLQDVTRERSLEQMKDGFLSVAAHQLRTPLGSMRWNMEMLLAGDVGELDAQPKEVVQNIYDSSQRLVILVNDLLNVSRIDQGAVSEESAATDALAIIQESMKALTPDAMKRSITVSVKASSLKGSSEVMVPPKRFYEAIQNLLSNAIKYNVQGGSVLFTVSKSGKTLHIDIKDTGIGIPKQGQSKVFSKFFRADNAVRTETDGTGLGLFVVKSFIEGCGGSIRFESSEGKGTTFFIELPLH